MDNVKDLKELTEKLGGIRGRHTELVTVYVSAGFSLSKIVDQIRQEQSTAQNIKSKAVRKNVMAALERILQHLKLYKATPPNGLALFCGNVSEKEGAADIVIWAVEPPEPIRTKLYWCGQDFILDPLKEMFREREVYGLVVLDKSEADIGMLYGKKVQSLKHMDSIVPGKTKKGGWSQARYARVREGLLNDFLKKVGDVASKQFKGMAEIKGVIVGGPGPIKEDFYNGDFLAYDVKKIVLGVVDTSYGGGPGLQELVDRSEDLLKEASVMHEKKILDRFFGEFAKDSGIGVYGLHEVMEAARAGNMEMLLISDGFDWVKASFECPKCGFRKEETMRREDASGQKCGQCGNPLKLTGENDLNEDVIKLAEATGAVIEHISIDTPKGEQLKELGGVAGILRYRKE